MIKTKALKIGDLDYTLTYSDEGRYVVRDGISYESARDLTELGRTYTEGDLIPVDESEASAEEALSIIMGGAE